MERTDGVGVLMKRRQPRNDAELEERTNVTRSDRIADRFERRYTDTHIQRIEEQRAPWLRKRRGRM